MKKKLLPLALALTLCLGLAVPAFAAEGTSPAVTLHGPENSGILMESKTETYSVVGFNRSTDNTAVAYMSPGTIDGVPTSLVPTGVDIIITGVNPEDEVVFTAWSAPGETGVLRQQLFILEPEKDAYVAPIPEDALVYMLPTDEGTEAKGNLTAAQLGFSLAQDGTITCGSGRLYELFEANTLLRIAIGDRFWLFQLSGEPALISSIFTDVPVGQWFTDPVAWARQNDITSGTGEGKFSPGNNCTQAQILTFLYRAARGEGAATAEDMEKAIAWAQEKGMIDDSFDGGKLCTRSTAVSYIWQALGKQQAAKAASFTDVDAGADYAEAVSWAVEKGITGGNNADGTTFGPDSVCTRGHIVTFLYRAYNN